MLAREIVAILESEPEMSVYAVVRTGADAVLVATQQRINVLVMDDHLPDMSGARAAGMIKAARPATAIVFYTPDATEEALLEAIDAGASAYLATSATANEVLEAVRRAHRGEVLTPSVASVKAMGLQRQIAAEELRRDTVLRQLTERELEVLRLLAQGLDTAAVARRLGVAPHTVEWHVGHLIEKFQVRSKVEVIIAAVNHGIIEL